MLFQWKFKVNQSICMSLSWIKDKNIPFRKCRQSIGVFHCANFVVRLMDEAWIAAMKTSVICSIIWCIVTTHAFLFHLTHVTWTHFEYVWLWQEQITIYLQNKKNFFWISHVIGGNSNILGDIIQCKTVIFDHCTTYFLATFLWVH